jgi:hypothetical protein
MRSFASKVTKVWLLTGESSFNLVVDSNCDTEVEDVAIYNEMRHWYVVGNRECSQWTTANDFELGRMKYDELFAKLQLAMRRSAAVRRNANEISTQKSLGNSWIQVLASVDFFSRLILQGGSVTLQQPSSNKFLKLIRSTRQLNELFLPRRLTPSTLGRHDCEEQPKSHPVFWVSLVAASIFKSLKEFPCWTLTVARPKSCYSAISVRYLSSRHQKIQRLSNPISRRNKGPFGGTNRQRHRMCL